MADELNLVNTQALASGVSSFTDGIIWIFAGLAIAAAIWSVWWFLSFKHKVRIRQQTNSGYVIIDTKARQFKNKDGVLKWRFLKYGQVVGEPPEGFVELTAKGKFSAECDRSLDGTVVWRKINKPGVMDVFTAEERTMVIHEMREAESYKKRNLTDIVLALAPILAILMIITVFLLFAGEVFAPIMEEGQAIRSERRVMHEEYKEITNIVSEICLNRPLLSAQIPGKGNVTIPN
jgi:hypothetical protein